MHVLIIALVIALVIITSRIAIVRKNKMDFAFLSGKVDEAEAAVTAAFQRAAAALTGAPSAAQISAVVTKIQSITDASNAVAPATPATPAP
jgi:hypothetical protein